MAQNKKKNSYKKDQDTKGKKAYKNPAKTYWGKTIICILALLMLFSGLISLILLMVLK